MVKVIRYPTPTHEPLGLTKEELEYSPLIEIESENRKIYLQSLDNKQCKYLKINPYKFIIDDSLFNNLT